MPPKSLKVIQRLLKLLFIGGIATIYASILLSYPEKNNLGIIVTNLIIVVYATYRAFFSQRYSYSLYQFFYIFALLFMGMAPLVQYKQSIQTVGGYDIFDDTYLLTNIILIAVFILIDFVYGYRNKKRNVAVEKEKVPAVISYKVKDTPILKICLLAICSVSLIYVLYINQNDLTGLFYRDIFIDRVNIEDSMIMILAGILRPLSVFAFIFYYKIGESKFFKTLLFVIALLTCFPLSLTRFLIGAYWLPVFLTVFSSLDRKKALGYMYVLGLLILFPIFEVFRAFSVYVEQGGLASVFFGKISEAFSSMTYDSYQSLAFVIQNHFITFGQQLLGVAGLFIPRSIWSDKPIGSGFTVSEQYNLGWDNISMNFFGEGYINFGIIGIFIFAVALAVAMRYLDGRYWTSKSKNNLLFPVVYLIILGIFAYIMRGDMIGSFTSTIGAIASATLVYSLICMARKVQG